MFKKSAEKELEQRVQELEKNAFERGLVESVPETNRTQPPPVKTRSRAKALRRKSRKKTASRILIIDDEDQFREMIAKFLQLAGYEVVQAANGEEGVKLFFQEPADLVISDVIMPEKEGIETVIEIKKNFPEAQLIVVSGGGWYGTEIDFDMAHKLGALTLKKPFELKELSAAVAKLLG